MVWLRLHRQSEGPPPMFNLEITTLARLLVASLDPDLDTVTTPKVAHG